MQVSEVGVGKRILLFFLVFELSDLEMAQSSAFFKCPRLFYVCANFLRAINISCPFVFVVTVYVLMSNIRHFFSKLIA